VYYPHILLCTDNGAMIAFAAALRLLNKPAAKNQDYAFTVKPRWDLAAIDDA
jgi:N6-L-threonylcarbamoyladenine synthase